MTEDNNQDVNATALTIFQKIERQENALKQSREQDKKMYPIGVTQQKNLRNLFNEKYGAIGRAIDDLQGKTQRLFREAYQDDIDASKERIDERRKEIETSVESYFDNHIRPKLKELYGKIHDIGESFDGNVSFDKTWGTRSDRIRGLNDTVREGSKQAVQDEFDRMFLMINIEYPNYLSKIDEKFDEVYNSFFDEMKEKIRKIRKLFEEAITLGDMDNAREIFYMIPDEDEYIRQLEVPEITKYPGIIEELEQEYLQKINVNLNDDHKEGVIDV